MSILTKDKIYKNRFIILFNVALMTFMACLDSSIVNVTLPMMANKLSVSNTTISWVVTSYLIVIAATILIFGKLGDITGKTKMFKVGIVLFTLGSFSCGMSRSIVSLILSRIIQAVGAASTMATNQGIITETFPSNERGKALGISGAFVALGTLVGPPLGGFIASFFSWEYIFLINIPIGITTFFISIKNFPKTKIKKSEPFDIKGALIFALAIISIFGSLLVGQNVGYSNLIILSLFLFSFILLIVFVAIEMRVKNPILRLNIFRNQLFTLSILCSFISFVTINCAIIAQPFYLQDVMKMSPAFTGLIMMAYPLILVVVAPISGHISDKTNSELLTFLGLMLTCIGVVLIGTLNEHSKLYSIIIFMVITSIGNGLFQSPNNSLIMSTVNPDSLGIAGSINALVRTLGMVVGITLSTTLLYSEMSKKLGYQVSSYVPGCDSAFVYGMKYASITAAVICFIGAFLTLLRICKKTKN